MRMEVLTKTNYIQKKEPAGYPTRISAQNLKEIKRGDRNNVVLHIWVPLNEKRFRAFVGVKL